MKTHLVSIYFRGNSYPIFFTGESNRISFSEIQKALWDTFQVKIPDGVTFSIF